VASLTAHGIAAALPVGFEGRIFVRPVVGDEETYPVAHFATFALPADVGDFGSGAVTQMGAADIFVALFEYGPASVGTRLFARQGLPRSLVAANFRTTILRRGISGQSGTQWFFTEAGRPFTLYVVLGSHTLRASLVPRVNELLRSVTVFPAASTAFPAASTAAGTGYSAPVAAAPLSPRWN
jgi:hypothetical protein